MNDFREWAPLTDLFGCLPLRVQSGLFPVYVKLTCVDVVSDFIALGSTVGIVYWYDRKKKVVQTLKGEDLSSEITAVKIVSTVDYMVACGYGNGKVSIFQVPKEHARDLPEQVLPKQEQQVERYTVGDMHKTSITALEWSRNGTKLFSGDQSGQVILTTVNFSMHLITSRYILNEASPVVQLSYNAQGLLISTKYRSIISKTDDWKVVTQIGTKDRRVLDKLGAIFYQKSPNPKDVVLYCSRPGLRLWISNLTGQVQKTLKYKDIIENLTQEVPLINPISKQVKQAKSRETSFGVLLPYNDLLVTHNNDILYLLDPNPDGPTVKAMVTNLRQIISVATCAKRKEIFVLEGDRSLIRIAEHPEYLLEPKVNKATSIQLSITKTLSGNDLTEHTDASIVANAEEAVESVVLNEKVKKLKAYEDISNQEFDDAIIYKPKSHKRGSSTTTASSASSDAESYSSQSVFMNTSVYGFKPDLRSYEEITKDIEEKEKKLASILCFDIMRRKEDVSQKRQNESSETPINSDWMHRSLNLDLRSSEVSKSNGIANMSKSQVDYGSRISDKKKAEENFIFATKSTIKDDNTPVIHSIPDTWNIEKLSLPEKQLENEPTLPKEKVNNATLQQIASSVKHTTTSGIQNFLTTIKSIPPLRMTQSYTEQSTKPRRKSSTDDDDWVIVGGNFTV